MKNGRGHQDSALLPFGNCICGPDPLAKVMLVGHDLRVLSHRTLGKEEIGVKPPGRKCWSDPTSNLDKYVGIDPNSGLFKQLTCRTRFEVFVRVELAAGECVESSLKSHMRRATHPKNFEFGILSDQNNCCSRS